jgi:hypothetical protein
MLGMIFLLLVAGHETTVNLISSGTLALLISPGEMARLRADRSLVPDAVEELLRYTSPVNHATFRFTSEPVEVGGTLVPAREAVLVAIGSANRDPGRYPAPDRLEVGRDARGNLAFGHGIHYCLGAPLARPSVRRSGTPFTAMPSPNWHIRIGGWARQANRSPGRRGAPVSAIGRTNAGLLTGKDRQRDYSLLPARPRA